MRERLLTAGELITVRANLYEIEKRLNRPIPRGVVNPADLKDRLLTTGELTTICNNIDSICKNHYPRERYTRIPDNIVAIEMIVGAIILGIALLGGTFGWF